MPLAHRYHASRKLARYKLLESELKKIAADAKFADVDMLAALEERLERLEGPKVRPCVACDRMTDFGSRCRSCARIFDGVEGDEMLEYVVAYRMGWPLGVKRAGLLDLLGMSAAEALAADVDELRDRYDAATAPERPKLVTGPVDSSGIAKWIPGGNQAFSINGKVTVLPVEPGRPQRPLSEAEAAFWADGQRRQAEELERAHKATQAAALRAEAEALLRRAGELAAV